MITECIRNMDMPVLTPHYRPRHILPLVEHLKGDGLYPVLSTYRMRARQAELEQG